MSARWKRPRPGAARQRTFAFAASRRAKPTSRAAACAVSPHVATQKHRILQWIISRMDLGATYPEVCDALGLRPNSVSGRLGELEKAGLIVDSGRTRPTPAGCRATVYVAAEYARREGRS